MPNKYRKKPVVIDAVQVTKWNVNDVAKWCNGDAYSVWSGFPYIEIKTLEGIMKADVGDWIIRGIKGEFYPCKDNIFQATYELEIEDA